MTKVKIHEFEGGKIGFSTENIDVRINKKSPIRSFDDNISQDEIDDKLKDGKINKLLRKRLKKLKKKQ